MGSAMLHPNAIGVDLHQLQICMQQRISKIKDYQLQYMDLEDNE